MNHQEANGRGQGNAELDGQTARLKNAGSVSLADVPELSLDAFQSLVTSSPQRHQRVCALFGRRELGRERADSVGLFAVLASDATSQIHIARTRVEGTTLASMTPGLTQVHLFERDIAERFGLFFEGHPWFKPVRFLADWDASARGGSSHVSRDPFGRDENHPKTVGLMDFYRVEGEEVHEVAVGPVHAGVIEPGHFRFQCHGEEVMHLEISLGYQHRGVERGMIECNPIRRVHYMETLAGDTTVGHATAYCQLLEELSGCRPTAKAHAIRAIGLELERLANHVGDLGALAGDVGFLPTASYCGRLRGDFLNLSAAICGSRFGRTLVRPGGVGHDIDAALSSQLGKQLNAVMKDVHNAVELLWEAATVQARFEGTGPVTTAVAEELGLVGVAARASGLERDVRHDHPSGFYRLAQIPMSVLSTGDVFARGHVRWLEVLRSAQFVQEQLESLPEGPLRKPVGSVAPNRISVSLVEGWRGEICHVALTDTAGGLETYRVYDPSFHNWFGLAMALRNQQISDFPLCNKSFNLSYCGHDL
jgi:Ni,Fe-hydrogenase III large subunit/NADH:ubiquinone oxidoreductase subunit C